MIKRLLFVSTLLIGFGAFAQTPQGISYQGVATDANGLELINQAISIRATVLSGSANGANQYQEAHATTTDQFGLFTITIGQGSNTGVGATTFANISWGANSHFLKIEMDATGGTSYMLMGTNQMLSVPYALYAESTDNVDDADADSTNELQILALSNDTLFLSSGGYAVLNSFTNTDNQTLTVNGDSISISNGNTIVIQDNTIDGDADPTNELQILSLSNDTLYLSAGGFVVLNSFVNTDNQTLSTSGDSISISNGNTIVIQDNVIDNDANPTNEIQNLNLSNDTLSISGGNSVILESIDYDSIAALLSNDSTFISNVGGGGVSPNWMFPDGLTGQSVSLTFMWGGSTLMSSYTVPAGKNLYINQTNVDGDVDLAINNKNVSNIRTGGNPNQFYIPIVATEGDVLTLGINSPTPSKAILNGFLIDKAVEPITIDLVNNPYTVPSNKTLVLFNYWGSGSTFGIYLNGNYTGAEIGLFGSANSQLKVPLIYSSGDILADQVSGTSTGNHILNGYLVDNNFFSAGGGSTSTINYDSLATILSTDSTFLANVGGMGGSPNLNFPDGLSNIEVVNHAFFNSSGSNNVPYTVPAGKNLYILNVGKTNTSSGVNLFLNGNFMYLMESNNSYRIHIPIIATDGDVLTSDATGYAYFHGFLVDKTVDIIHHDFSGGTTDYTVPTGKKLVIMDVNCTYAGNGESFIDGIFLSDFSWLQQQKLQSPVIVNEQSVVSANVWSGDGYIHGYLVDNNHFSASGGGANNTSLQIDSVYKYSINSNSCNSTSDTISLNYQDGRSLMLSGTISGSTYISQFLIVRDDNFNVISTNNYKVNGTKHSIGGTFYPAIGAEEAVGNDSRTFMKEIEFYNLNTSLIYIYLQTVCSQPVSPPNSTITIQY